MGMIIGPTPWWQANLVASLPLGGILPDGSRITCKAGGTAWIVAPSTTQVSLQWADGKYNGIDAPGTEVCCISEWTTLQTCLISRGFNPSDWFVPNTSQLQTAGYACRFFWDSVSATACYWSSAENTANNACAVFFNNASVPSISKTNAGCVRAFRCVTY